MPHNEHSIWRRQWQKRGYRMAAFFMYSAWGGELRFTDTSEDWQQVQSYVTGLNNFRTQRDEIRAKIPAIKEMLAHRHDYVGALEGVYSKINVKLERQLFESQEFDEWIKKIKSKLSAAETAFGSGLVISGLISAPTAPEIDDFLNQMRDVIPMYTPAGTAEIREGFKKMYRAHAETSALADAVIKSLQRMQELEKNGEYEVRRLSCALYTTSDLNRFVARTGLDLGDEPRFEIVMLLRAGDNPDLNMARQWDLVDADHMIKTLKAAGHQEEAQTEIDRVGLKIAAAEERLGPRPDYADLHNPTAVEIEHNDTWDEQYLAMQASFESEVEGLKDALSGLDDLFRERAEGLARRYNATAYSIGRHARIDARKMKIKLATNMVTLSTSVIRIIATSGMDGLAWYSACKAIVDVTIEVVERAVMNLDRLNKAVLADVEVMKEVVDHLLTELQSAGLMADYNTFVAKSLDYAPEDIEVILADRSRKDQWLSVAGALTELVVGIPFQRWLKNTDAYVRHLELYATGLNTFRKDVAETKAELNRTYQALVQVYPDLDLEGIDMPWASRVGNPRSLFEGKKIELNRTLDSLFDVHQAAFARLEVRINTYRDAMDQIGGMLNSVASGVQSDEDFAVSYGKMGAIGMSAATLASTLVPPLVEAVDATVYVVKAL